MEFVFLFGVHDRFRSRMEEYNDNRDHGEVYDDPNIFPKRIDAF